MTRFVESTIMFPYRRSLGPVVGAFMTALTERRILGIRCGESVLVPPMEWDPATGAELPHEFVEVGPAGTVESWTWVPAPSEQHPLRPSLRLRLHPPRRGDHAAAARASTRASPDAMVEGLRVAPRWRGTRVGRIDDIICFVPGEADEIEGDDGGAAEEPVTRMDYLASITYRNPGPDRSRPFRRGHREHRLSVFVARSATGSTPAGGGTARSTPLSSGPNAKSTFPTPAPSPTSPSSPPSSIRARPRPSPSSGPLSCSTAPMSIVPIHR